MRFTPTFYSIALDNEGYQPRTNQHLPQHKPGQPSTSRVCYANNSKNQRVWMLNPGQGCFNVDTRVEWYDDDKKIMIEEYANISKNNPKVRKMTELASDKVFPGIHLAWKGE